jgi:pilus assembly protein CpaB
MAILVQVMLGGDDKPAPVEQEPRAQILIAAKDLSIARELKSGDLKWQNWPKSNLFPGAIVREEGQKPEEALEGRLRRDVSEGEPVLKSYLIGESKGNFVAASLEAGQRAVSIQVSATTMVAGFVSPGDFVDVVLTYKQKMSVNDEDPRVQQMLELNLDSVATETILENVKVLAIDQMATRPKDDKIRVGKTVTLALSVENTERIILAQQIGDLTLVLRGIGDEAPIERKWPIVSDARLVTVDDEIYEKYSKMKNETGIQTNNVRIYSGEALQVIPSR